MCAHTYIIPDFSYRAGDPAGRKLTGHSRPHRLPNHGSKQHDEATIRPTEKRMVTGLPSSGENLENIKSQLYITHLPRSAFEKLKNKGN